MEKVVFYTEKIESDCLYAQSNIVFEKLRIYGDGTMMENVVCADKPCILSWPMVISGSVNEFFVAV